MKEKRLIAMFITSAVTLVASLVVTFGVLMTLADPVVATGVVRYQYAFNYANSSLISNDGNTLKLSENIIFQPASATAWTEEDGKQPVWFNGSTYEDEIVYCDESISSRIKVIPIRVVNKYSKAIQASLKVTYDKTTMLGKYTYVMIYDYSTSTFKTLNSSMSLDLAANASVDYAVVILADDSSNTGLTTVDWGTEYLSVNVEITNTTASVM